MLFDQFSLFWSAESGKIRADSNWYFVTVLLLENDRRTALVKTRPQA